jgi:Bacterial protein of unknown function (DUF885)
VSVRPLLLLLALSTSAAATEPMSIDALPIPGPRKFVALARDVIDAAAAVDPSLASNAGLFDDAVRVPHYDPASIKALERRLDKDLRKLAGLPWRSWDTSTQVDFRWVYAVGETVRRVVTVENVYTHRPGQWLEPVANNLLAFQTYVPERTELQDGVLDQVPAMLDDIRARCTEPTARDLVVTQGLVEALSAVASDRGHAAAMNALDGFGAELAALEPTRDYAVIGAENYAWRLKHTLLLPWSPAELLAKAKAELERVEAELAALPEPAAPPAPTPEQDTRAAAMERADMLALYDGVSAATRQATLDGGWVSIPPGVGPVVARETPRAIIALSGDGGSMNPPPTYADTDVGYWNVENFDPALPFEARLAKVTTADRFRDNGMGPYAVHEGVPGHHLQLAVARLNPDPIRSILPDCVQNEGWGLYAEEVFYDHGGLGTSVAANASMLRSYRSRIRRVPVDVNVETERWTLDEAAAWKHGTGGEVDGDMLRAINWPTQLVCYFAGKQQIVALRDEARARAGDAWDERKFHDALLNAGSIPLALVRAELLGEPVPDLWADEPR